MIDFACKEFKLQDIVKCSLGLTKADQSVFEYLLKNQEPIQTETLAKKLRLDLSTTQRAVKKLTEKGLLLRTQKNLRAGGYVFYYQTQDKKIIRKIIIDIVNRWTIRVEQELNSW